MGYPGSARVLASVVLGAACWLAPAAGSGQAPGGASPLGGALWGAGVGIVAGLGLAQATDYPLEEGGGITVAWLGGALGALHGHKLGSSWGRPWRAPGRLHVSFPWGHARSGASDDIEEALAASGFSGRDEHHALAPAVTVLYDVLGPIRLGGEISGIRAVNARASHELGRVTESIDGRIVSALLAVGPRPTEVRRLTYSLGVGVDRYSVEALSYFDQKLGTGLPPDAAQPDRTARARAEEWGGHVRLGVEWSLTYDVSLQLNVVKRWHEAIQVPGMRLIDAERRPVLEHLPHPVAMESVRIDVGFGLRY